MNQILVSIAMATYNGELYVAQQLDSILNQTYSNLEIIIVDDNSQDNTYQILQNYAHKHDNIKLFKNKVNYGVALTFSRALSLTTGQFIACADQDDVWFANKIELLVNNIGDNMLIHSDDVVVDNNLAIIHSSHFAMSKNIYWNNFQDYLISVNVTGCTILVSRYLLEIALPIPHNFIIHDWYLAIIAAYYNKIKLLNIPLLYYRQHNRNVSGVRKKTYHDFKQHATIFAKNLYSLSQLDIFNNSKDLLLMSRYWQAIADHKFDKRLLAQMLCFSHRFKLIVLMLILVLPPPAIAKIFYNLIRKLV